MKKRRLLFFGDGFWATNALRLLRDEPWELVGVVVRIRPSDPELMTEAKTLGLEVFQPERVNDPSFLQTVARLTPDLNISVSYDQFLGAPLRGSAPLGFINFHAGKLPNYRGRNVINWAIMNNEREAGITAHHVDDGIDTGDIILQRTLPILWTDTYADMLGKITSAFPDLVVDTLRLVDSARVVRVPQAHEPGTYFTSRGDGDEWLDWSDTSLNIYNKVRAITRPGPGARSWQDGRQVVIWRAEYDPAWPKYMATPGQVVGRRRGHGVVVKTGDSTILLTESQTAGGEIVVPAWPIGSRLSENLSKVVSELSARVASLEALLHRSGAAAGTDDHGVRKDLK